MVRCGWGQEDESCTGWRSVSGLKIPHCEDVDGSSDAHPFETEAGDHAETPFNAYRHIAPLLVRMATFLSLWVYMCVRLSYRPLLVSPSSSSLSFPLYGLVRANKRVRA